MANTVIVNKNKIMGIKRVENISKAQKFWKTARYGLILLAIRNRLARIGLDIKPYYWVQEEVEECKEPLIKGDSSEYFLE